MSREGRKFSLSVDKVTEIVNNIASQYAKDIHNGGGFSSEKYDEYRSELFVKAYEVMSASNTVNEPYMYKVLWNHASDTFHKMMDTSVREYSNQFINLDVEDLLGSETHAVLPDHEEVDDEDARTDRVIRGLVELLSSRPSASRKYFIARFILSGVQIDDYFSEDDPDKLEVESLGVSLEDAMNYKSIDEYVLTHINKYSPSSAKTGGPGSFKSHKSQLREDYIYSNDLDAVTYKNYELDYVVEGSSELKTTKVRAYDFNHAERLLNQYLDRRGISKEQYVLKRVTVL